MAQHVVLQTLSTRICFRKVTCKHFPYSYLQTSKEYVMACSTIAQNHSSYRPNGKSKLQHFSIKLFIALLAALSKLFLTTLETHYGA